MRGLNKIYYNMFIKASTNDPHEISVLSRLKAGHWTKALICESDSEDILKDLASLTGLYKAQIDTKGSEDTKTSKLKMTGKRNIK